MSMLVWNLRGIRSNKDDLIKLIREHQTQIVLLQETKLQANEKIQLSNFHTFSRNVVCQGNQIAHGGVAILVKPEMEPVRLKIKTTLQAVAVKICIFNPIVVCSLYVQEVDRVPKAQLQNLINQLGPRFILAGDFNAHTPLTGHSDYNSLGEIFEDLIEENGLLLSNNDEATHLNKASGKWSTLDWTLSKNVNSITDWHTYPDLANSDHLPIIFSIFDWNNNPSHQTQRYQEHKANWTDFQRLSSTIDIEDNDPEGITKFTQQLIRIADRTIPKSGRNVHRRVVPWWSKDTENAVKNRKKALRRLKRNDNLRNRIELNRATAIAKREIKKAKRDSRKKLCESISSSTPVREIFQNVKRIQGASNSRRIRLLKGNDGNALTEDYAMANLLADKFSSESSDTKYSMGFRINKTLKELRPVFIPDSNHPINNDFSYVELELALTKCNGRSSGPDKVSYGMLKNLSPQAKSLLLQVFNTMWQSRSFPESWRHSHVIPLLKPGKSSTSPDSYRPISLTSNLSKLFERMAMRRLNFWIEKNKFLHNSQNGFRKHRSVTDNIVVLHRTGIEALNRNEHAICLFFDLKKAYDRVWRRLVLEKLLEWGLGGNILHFLSNFLKERTLRVICNGTESKIVDLDNGVPQGSVAAVTSFLVAVSDYEKDLEREFSARFPSIQLVILAYADDKSAIVSGATNDPRVLEAAQFIADFTVTWMSDHGLELSASKTQILHVCAKRNCKKITLKVDGMTVRDQPLVDFLGIKVDRHFLWRQHLKYRRSSCVKPLNAIKMLSNTKFDVNSEILLRIVDSIITSRLLYGCEVYFDTAKSNLKSIQSTYMAAIRTAIGAFRTSPLESITFESGKLSLEHLILKQNMCYCFRTLENRHLNEFGVTERTNSRFKRTIGDYFQDNLQYFDLQNAQVIRSKTGLAPWGYRRFQIDTSLRNTKKEGSSMAILKAMAMEKLQNHQGRHLIFTDGSRSEGRTGLSVVLPERAIIKRLPDQTSVYMAELLAIYMAIKEAQNLRENVTIVTDSLSSLDAIQNFETRNPVTNLIQRLLGENTFIRLLFVHSHTGLSGNELADDKAREATEKQEPDFLDLGLHDIKKAISRGILRRRKIVWEQVPLSNKLRSVMNEPTPRTEYLSGKRIYDRAITRLRLGHARITHSFLFQLPHRPPICEVCQSQITVEHLLVSCPKFSTIRTHLGMAPSLRDVFADTPKLIEFLKASQLLKEI